MKYNAFLSYSHAQDSDLAPHLETALEKFAKPLFKQRALNIFRDANDLSASPDLWGKIEEGLNNSEYFIFLASPKAAQSRWCKKEVDCWKANHDMSNFLVVMTDGEIAWDESISDFDWSKTTAIPDNLSGAFVNEPLYVDFRNHNNAESGLEYPDFKTKTVLLAATIHGKTVGNMIGENLRQHKRMLRIRNSAIGILSALLIAVGAAGFYANKQKKEAESQTKIALLSSYLGNSRALQNEDPTISLRIAEHAYKFAVKNNLPTQESIEQLIKVFYSGYGFYQQPTNTSIELLPKLKKEINGIRLDTGKIFQPRTKISGKGSVSIFEKDSLNRVPHIHRFETKKSHIDFSKDGSLLIANKYSYFIDDYSIEIFNRQNTNKLFEIEGYTVYGQPSIDTGIYIEPTPRAAINFNFVLIAGADLEKPLLFSNINIDEFTELDLDGFLGDVNHINDVAISKDGKYSVLGSKNGKTIMIDNYEYGLKYLSKNNENKGKFNRFERDRYILKNIGQQTIDRVAFSKNGRFIETKQYIYDSLTRIKSIEAKSYDQNLASELSKPQDSIMFTWKSTPFPYIVIESREKHNNLELNNGYYLKFERDKNSIIIFKKPYFLMNKYGDSIAQFASLDLRKNAPSKTKNGLYFVNAVGLNNASGKLLIKLELDFTEIIGSHYSFSTNQQFLKIDIEDSNNISFFSLDPEFIINRFNNEDDFGSIYQLSAEEKEQYQIKDLD